jgi:integrase
MPRPKKDGSPAAAPDKRKLSEVYLQRVKPKDHAFCTWDTDKPGLAMLVQPSGTKSFKFVYRLRGRPCWYHIGNAATIGLADARKLVIELAYRVSKGEDIIATRKAERDAGSFAELAARYVEEYAKKNNKSYKQAEALVQRHLLPKWGRSPAHTISRADVKAMMARISTTAPIAANQVLAAASAIFAWAIKEDIIGGVNPCSGVERNDTQSRERVLANSEVPRFWAAFDAAGPVRSTALKLILVTGQRPGEIAHMRREHIVDGWWKMPGEPVPALDWPGTKNAQSHDVWLSPVAQQLLAELSAGEELTTGLVFAGPRGAAIDGLDGAMRRACFDIGVPRAVPHDLRRTFSTTVAALGFGRDAMNRVTNHKEGGIANVYDRHGYAEENKRVMEAVAAMIMSLVDPTAAAKIIPLVDCTAAAKIMALIDPTTAVKIMSLVDPTTAAKIMSVVDSATAAKIMSLIDGSAGDNVVTFAAARPR